MCICVYLVREILCLLLLSDILPLKKLPFIFIIQLGHQNYNFSLFSVFEILIILILVSFQFSDH